MRFIIILLLSAFFGTSIAQQNIGFELIDSVAVVRNGEPLSAAWAGGMNNPQFSVVDITGNSDMEIFVYDRDGSLRKGFKYNPAKRKHDWIKTIPETSEPFHSQFPLVEDRGFCLLRDYDGDGDMDVFTLSNFTSIKVFRNDGNGEYTVMKEALTFTRGSNETAFRLIKNTIPIIKDLDEDGDLDLMFFPLNTAPFNCGSFATFLNQSIEEYGTADSLEFIIGSYCWGGIRVGFNAQSDTFQFEEYECGPNSCEETANREKHQTMTQNLHDVNGDGTLDLLTTYDHNDELFYTPNFGDNINGDLDLSATDYEFPSNDVKVDVENQPYPYFIDVDLDGDDDMIISANQINSVSSLEGDTSESIFTDAIYENVGSNSAPVFELKGDGFLSAQMIDIGLQSMPTFCDLNGDSLLDIMVGSIGYNSFYPVLSGAQIHYFKNIGTMGAPVYTLEPLTIFGLQDLDLRSAHPALADLDNDGDQDLVIGDHTGHLQYFENTGTPNTPEFIVLTPNYELIDAGGAGHPHFYDLNSDGKLDLLVGDEYGRIQYYENQGTKEEPNFPAQPTIKDFGKIDVFSDYGGQASPYLTRQADSTDNLFLFVGTASGQINVYGPITSLGDKFELADSIVLEATNTSIAGANIIGGERPELIIGQHAGGLYMMQKENDQALGIAAVSPIESSFKIHPNPTTGLAIVSGAIHEKNAWITVTSLNESQVMRRRVQPESTGMINETIDLNHFPSGVYIVSLKTFSSLEWARLLKH